MSIEQETSQDNQSVPAVQSVSMAAVGVRAAFWTVVALALLFACVLSFSPYTAMQFYVKIDCKDMALMSAEKYLSRHDDAYGEHRLPPPNGKYADALYLATGYSIDFMNATLAKKGRDSRDTLFYARKAETYINEYLSYNSTGSLLDRTREIDAYSLSHTVAAMHPYVYSYSDYLQTTRFKTWYLLDKAETLLERVDTATTPWIVTDENWVLQDGDTVIIDDLFLLLMQLTAYIDTELDALGLSEDIASAKGHVLRVEQVRDRSLLSGVNKPFDLFVYDSSDSPSFGNGETTNLYKNLTVHFGALVDYLRRNCVRYTYDALEADKAQHLRLTYRLKILNDFTKSMRNMTAVLSGQTQYFDDAYTAELRKTHTDWESLGWVKGDGKMRITRDGKREIIGTDAGVFVEDWYTFGMLYDYVHWRNTLI